MTNLSYPIEKPNKKPTSHKLDIVVDLTNLLHCYKQDPSPSIMPSPFCGLSKKPKKR
jgi:hypothetical protein